MMTGAHSLASARPTPPDGKNVRHAERDICRCDAQGCAYNCAYNPQMIGQILVELDGSELDADFPDTVVELAGRHATVRFQRVASP